MSNPFEINFTLKQHTPIIHFQHTQDGATLRATEVKPKLDKFIIEKCDLTQIVSGKEVPKPEFKSCFINEGKQHLALDYKLRIISCENEDNDERMVFESYEEARTRKVKYRVTKKNKGGRNIYPMILANMAGQDNVDKLKDIRFFEKLECSIICLNKPLKTEIETHLESFFAMNNFGNRSNKGFGGFTISEINKKTKKWTEELLPTSTYFLNVPSEDMDKVLNVIDYFYKWLKSGINYSYDGNNDRCNSGRYKKAVLFEYLESLYKSTPTSVKENWEKRWMKENFLSLRASTAPYAPKYYRALLGLSDKHTFSKANCYTDEEAVSEKQCVLTGKIELQNKHSESKIDRIKSPFTFKVVNISNTLTKVYILIDNAHIKEIYYGMYSKYFTFYKDSEIKINYTLNGQQFTKDFNYPKDNLLLLDEHLTRLSTHLDKGPLKEMYDKIIQFKSQFFDIDLPNTQINYEDLLKFFVKKYPSFRAKDFRWRDIIDSEIKIQTT